MTCSARFDLERDIEAALVQAVRAAGGEIRKVQWIGRKHAPDRRLMHTRLQAWVECKRPGGRLRAGQAREIVRMTKQGERVLVVSTRGHVDLLAAYLEGEYMPAGALWELEP